MFFLSVNSSGSRSSTQRSPNAWAPRHVLVGATLFTALAACSDSSQGSKATLLEPSFRSAAEAPRGFAADRIGDPIPGLTAAELAAFQRGKLIFEKRFQPEEGLGPLYNATSCASCHSTPATGGSSQLYRNFFLGRLARGAQSFMLPNLPSPVVPNYGPRDEVGMSVTPFDLEAGRYELPVSNPNLTAVIAQRNALPIFGIGLFEFISNATILANSDPMDADGDGISGRPNYDFGDLGRFGVKAQSNNLERFTRPPLFNQMGITSEAFLGSAGTISLSSAAAQATSDPDEAFTDQDSMPDPEISSGDLGDLIAFSRFLAPVPRLPFSAAAEQGELIFHQMGCASCHIPSLMSSRGPVEAYTDLLLHDMGPGLADGMLFGIPSPGPRSTASEFRTQPLWGVSLHAPFLHDGRAETLYEAVEEHGGEAQASRDLFVGLPVDQRRAVLIFLEHL